MKSLFSILAFTLIAHSAFAAEAKPIFKKVFNDADDQKIEAYVLETYKEVAESTQDNVIKKKIAEINKDYGSQNAVRLPIASDLFKLGQGRGGMGIYGADYLIGLPLEPQGHGMIESYGAYIHAYADLNENKGTITITLENFAEIVDKK